MEEVRDGWVSSYCANNFNHFTDHLPRLFNHSVRRFNFWWLSSSKSKRLFIFLSPASAILARSCISLTPSDEDERGGGGGRLRPFAGFTRATISIWDGVGRDLCCSQVLPSCKDQSSISTIKSQKWEEICKKSEKSKSIITNKFWQEVTLSGIDPARLSPGWAPSLLTNQPHSL